MTERMRLFIAMDVPVKVREALVAEQQSLREHSSARLRWARPEAMHITLKFLGNVDASRIPSLSQAMAEVAGPHRSFTLSLGRLGVFPNTRRPQVIWTSVEGDALALAALRNALEIALIAQDYEADARPFRPHVTLGRARNSMRPDEAERISASLLTLTLPGKLDFTARRIALYRSHLGAGGSQCEVLATADLSEA